MSFLYPSFLWALFAILIPIIIHFFNFRTHKIVYFSNVAFLHNIEKENKSKNKLKDLLILLFRILAVASLVIAFAQPVLKKDFQSNNTEYGNQYGIYIDNSFSMNALSTDGKNIDVAKSKASDIVNSLKQNSYYFYFTNKLSAQEQHSYIKDIVQNFISITEISPNSKNISFILDKFSSVFAENNDNCTHKIFIISDFQKNSFDKENFKGYDNLDVFLLPTEPVETSNLYIDSVWFNSPFRLFNNMDSITVRLTNKSSLDFNNQQIKLYINDTLKTLSTFNISANSTSEIVLKFTNTEKGFINGKIEINDYPIDYDNTMFFNFFIAPQIEILLIKENNNKNLEKFYDNNQYFKLTIADFSNIPVGDFAKYQTIILSSVQNLSSGVLNELKNYVSSGGTVIIIPNLSTDLNNLNLIAQYFGFPLFTGKVSNNLNVNQINLNDKIYKNAFEEIKPNSEMPYLKEYYKINKNSSFDYVNLLSLENNDNILISRDIGEGAVYLFTTDLIENNTNFMTNPIAVPTFFNMPVFVKNTNKIYYIIGDEKPVEMKNINNFEMLKFTNIQANLEFIPQVSKIDNNKIKVFFKDVDLFAGSYKITESDKTLSLISFNYNRKESDLEHYTSNELSEFIENNKLDWKVTGKTGEFLQNEIISGVKTSTIWKYFIILALLFLLAEITIIRLLKSNK